jgi:hypothetical protein
MNVFNKIGDARKAIWCECPAIREKVFVIQSSLCCDALMATEMRV